jgi:hypothetical protein
MSQLRTPRLEPGTAGLVDPRRLPSVPPGGNLNLHLLEAPDRDVPAPDDGPEAA